MSSSERTIRSDRTSDLPELLQGIIAEFPPMPTAVGPMNPDHPSYLRRLAFDLSLVLDRLRPGDVVVDVGGGGGLFSLALADLGMRSVLLDDFVSNPYRDAIFAVFERHGVEVLERDAIVDGLGFDQGSVDAVTSFHFLEHVHSSPKKLFRECAASLRPGGRFVLAGPNSVNLRKRLTAPFGHYKWSTMEHWYETPEFRGHVREPDVDDLRYIVRDIGLHEVAVHGRNFLGQGHTGVVGALATRGSPLLERRPSLCSDIYIVAERR